MDDKVLLADVNVCNIGELRERAKPFKVADIVNLAGVSKVSAYAVFSGRQDNPTVKLLEKLWLAVRALEAGGDPK